MEDNETFFVFKTCVMEFPHVSRMFREACSQLYTGTFSWSECGEGVLGDGLVDGGVTFLVNPSTARCGMKFLSPTTVWGRS